MMQSLRTLFEEALAHPPQDRAAYLLQRCGDPEQRAKVERMLAFDARDEDTGLARDAGAVARTIGDPDLAQSLPPGTRIGPFELLAVLGEGGSSTVFRAARTIDGVRQVVALKLLRRGVYSTDAQRQFRRERLALSQLEHPGIARLIEGGVSETGFAYIALELVEGHAISTYVRERHLELRQRLALFLQVCRAVESAHQALIVHRDLKPSNVFVNADGQIKLLDFGVAKLLEGDDDTQTRAPAFTPGYAAPEQHSGGLITTATDVYALGILLGELVTGERFNDGSGRTPSARVGERGVRDPATGLVTIARRQLRGDVDNIVLKATAIEPERRYVSAGAFADDIERLMEGRPVTAHPASTWYRARKFIARHKGGVLTTTALLLAIIAALGVALWQADIARRQTREARSQAERAEAVKDLLVGIFDAEIPQRPRDQMPDTAHLLEEGAKRARSDLRDVPAVQAEMLTALGHVYNKLGMQAKSEPLLVDAIAAARRVDPPDARLLGAALSERGRVDVALNRFASALTLLDQAVALQTRAVPDSLNLAETLNQRAQAYSESGKLDQAVADYRAALAIRERRLPPDDMQILDTYEKIGTAYDRAGRFAESTDYLRKAFEAAQAKFGNAHVTTTHYMKNYAANLGWRNQLASAIALTEQAVAIERTLYPKGDPDIGNGLNNLGYDNFLLGRVHVALDAFNEVRTLNRDAGRNSTRGQVFVLMNLAGVYAVLDDKTQQRALLDEAAAIANKVFGTDNGIALVATMRRMAAEFDASPDATHAAALLDAAERVVQKPESLGQLRSDAQIESMVAIGRAQGAIGHGDQALQTMRSAIAHLPADQIDPRMLPAMIALVDWERIHAASSEAQSVLRAFIPRMARELPPTHFALGEFELVHAELLAADQKPADARQALAATDEAFNELPSTHPWRQRAATLRQELSLH